MKSVMISIKPKYCELIANGKKTIEVRKTKPKLETPFKCYIYCTSVKNLSLKEYVEIHSKTGGAIDDWSGKVIGEFVCDGILSHCEMANADIAEQQGKIKREDLIKYANGKEVYGWHISDLKIYDETYHITNFYKEKTEHCGWAECDLCKYGYKDNSEYGYACKSIITRPPQSWCYVEELK